VSAKNFPYEGPTTMWEACERPIDRYRENYDKVFSSTEPQKFEWAGIPVKIDPEMPRNELHLRDSIGQVHKITNLKI
jgi:hypothetical protein